MFAVVVVVIVNVVVVVVVFVIFGVAAVVAVVSVVVFFVLLVYLLISSVVHPSFTGSTNQTPLPRYVDKLAERALGAAATDSAIPVSQGAGASRIHAAWHQTSCRTGRLSCSRPNLQQARHAKSQYISQLQPSIRWTRLLVTGMVYMLCL